MPAADDERAIRLDRHLDALLRDTEPPDDQLDADLAATLLHLHTLSSRPVPDPAFVQSLNDALVGGAINQVRPEVASANRVILRNEGSRHIVDNISHEPRLPPPQAPLRGGGSLASAQNDTLAAPHPGTASSPNGNVQQARALPDRSPLALARPWWQRLEIAAAVFIVAVLGAYLAIANLGRTVPPPSRLTSIQAQTEGAVPVQLRIDALGVDAPIEVHLPLADGTSRRAENIWATGWRDGEPVPMPEPSEPFAVAWLDESAMPGVGGNVVLQGHLDYWGTGPAYGDGAPAVFSILADLAEGHRIDITGANDVVYTYEFEWSRRFPSMIDEEQQREILGPTDKESLTLITTAGEFDPEAMSYPEVLVVRARLVDSATPAKGVEPVRLLIDTIGVDALIAPRQLLDEHELIRVGSDLIVADVLDDEWILIPPDSDQSVVAWRDDSAALGEGSNVVLEGRLDYSWTKPAVFWSLKGLRPGDQIEVIGADRTVSSYRVDWTRRFPLAADSTQRREILGPTDAERLTLITSAGELNRTTGFYRDVLVVRAHFIGTTPLDVLAIPDPSDCLTAPQSVDALEAASTLIAKPRQAPTPTPLTDLEGEPADAKTIEAVIKAEQELVACLNANDPLRTYALYTGDGLLRLMRYIGGPMDALYEWTPDFSGLATPAPPRPTTAWLALLAVEDVRVLPDGRVAALVTIGPQGTGMVGVPTGLPVVHIFQPGERYFIDEFIVPSLATPATS